MDSTCRIIGWKLEVADRYAWEAIKSFESNILAERNAVKDGTKRGNPKLVGVDRPSKAGVMQKERGECSEPPKILSVLSSKKYLLRLTVLCW